MSFVIQLPREAEARLAEKAKRAGVDVTTFVERILQTEATRPPLDEILAPVRQAFHDSGMTEDQLSDTLVAAKKRIHAERRGRENK